MNSLTLITMGIGSGSVSEIKTPGYTKFIDDWSTNGPSVTFCQYSIQ